MLGLGLRHCAQLFVGAGIPPRLRASKMSIAKHNNGALSSSGASLDSNNFQSCSRTARKIGDCWATAGATHSRALACIAKLASWSMTLRPRPSTPSLANDKNGNHLHLSND